MKFNRFACRINCVVVLNVCQLLIASSFCDYKLLVEYCGSVGHDFRRSNGFFGAVSSAAYWHGARPSK